MIVTKQEQLEWLAKNCLMWPGGDTSTIRMSIYALGAIATDTDYTDFNLISKEEWKLERDKMQKKQGNSWHERCELPPPETYCQFKKANDECGWVNCFVVGIDDLGFCVCRADMDYHASMSASDFRPLRTERERAIEDMVKIMTETQRANLEINASALYAAGYRKITSQGN